MLILTVTNINCTPTPPNFLITQPQFTRLKKVYVPKVTTAMTGIFSGPQGKHIRTSNIPSNTQVFNHQRQNQKGGR